MSLLHRYQIKPKAVVENGKKQLKRVQARKEEVLTISVVIKWLKEGAEEGAAKKNPKAKKLNRFLWVDLISKKFEITRSSRNGQSTRIDGDNNNGHMVYGHLHKDNSLKGNWQICNLCDEYICLVRVPKKTDSNDDFYGKKCSDWNANIKIVVLQNIIFKKMPVNVKCGIFQVFFKFNIFLPHCKALRKGVNNETWK